MKNLHIWGILKQSISKWRFECVFMRRFGIGTKILKIEPYRYKSEAERSENPQNWRFSQNFFKTTVQTLRRQRLLPRVRWTPHGPAQRPPSRFHRHDKLQKFQIHPLHKKPIIPSDSPPFLLSSSVKSLPSQNTTVSTSSASPSFIYFRT